MHTVEVYERAVYWLTRHAPGEDKFLHTYAGLTIWVVAAAILRRPLGSALPIAVVILIELINECIDYAWHGIFISVDTLGDMFATWFWPLLLSFIIRWRSMQDRGTSDHSGEAD